MGYSDGRCFACTVHHLEGTSTLPTAVACLHAQHTHRRWPASGEIFAYVWGNFCARPELRKRRKNFCARPRKIVRTPPNKFAYANFAYVQQNFVRKRTEPKFCVRPENFAYVHERTKNWFVRPRKILRTSRKILRTSKTFLRTSKMLRFRGSARPEQISGLRSGSLLLLIRWHSAHGLGLLLGLARLSRLYICYW